MAKVGDRADTGPRQPFADIARQVEMRLARDLVRDEKGAAFWVFGAEARDEFGPDLVGILGDGRSHRRHDAFRPRAELAHGFDRGLDDAAERPLPTGMRGADHARLAVAEQHWCA